GNLFQIIWGGRPSPRFLARPRGHPRGLPRINRIASRVLHIIKLCVACDSVEELAEWQRKRKPLAHWTRNRPKRDKEIIAGRSPYLGVKGEIRVRQRILGLERRED